jgi:hypothetical protein
VFKLADGTYQDKNGFKITKSAIVKNYTDDARLADITWNNRHHVTPSNFNSTNHKYYTVSKLNNRSTETNLYAFLFKKT